MHEFMESQSKVSISDIHMEKQERKKNIED